MLHYEERIGVNNTLDSNTGNWTVGAVWDRNSIPVDPMSNLFGFTQVSSSITTTIVNWDITSTQNTLGQTIGYQVVARDPSGNITYDTYLTPDGYIARQVQYSNGLTATVTQGDITYSATVTTDPVTGAQIFTPIAVQITGVTGTLTPNADGTITVPGNGGDFTIALPTDPLKAITVSAGGQTLSVPAGSSIQLSGSDLQIQNYGAMGDDTIQIAANGNFFKMHVNPDNSNIVDTYDSSTGTYGHTLTDPFGNWKTTDTTYPAAGVTSQTWTASDNSHGDFYKAADGSTTQVIYRPNGDSAVYEHDVLGHADRMTNQINGDVYQTSYDSVSQVLSLSVNNNQTFSAILSGGDGSGTLTGGVGSDILIGGTGTATTVINGQEVVFSVTRTGANPADPASYKITGVDSVDGAVDATTIAAVNETLLASGYKLTDVAVGNPDVQNLVVVADPNATGQEQIVTAAQNPGATPDFLTSFYNWSKSKGGADLAQGLNGAHTLLTALRTGDTKNTIGGFITMEAAYNNFIDPKAYNALTNELNGIVTYMGYLNTAMGLRNALRSGDGKAIAVANDEMGRMAA
jgi:hypothetical protein